MTGTAPRTAVRLAFSLAAAILLAVGLATPWRLLAQAPEPAKGVKYAQISQADLKDWLTYLASDELQGRQIFTEGYGLAASYVADHLRQWGVKPLGDDGTYFQPVKLKGYKVTRNSSITVTVNGQSKTFKHGDHVTFPPNSGGKQTVTFSGIEFVGYGGQSDYQGRDVKNKLVVWLPNRSSPAGGRGAGRGGGGNGAAISTGGAKAIISFSPTPAAPSDAEEALARAQAALAQSQQAVAQAQQQVQGRGQSPTGGARGRGGAAGGRGAAPAPDLTTVLRVENPVPPQVSADDTFFEFLFSGSPTTFAELNAKAGRGEALASRTLSNVTASITIDNTFDVLTTQLSKNVVGMIEGSDPKLKDTYVMFGAHLDHIGYRPAGGARPGAGSCRRTQESVAAAAAQGGRGGAGRGGTPTVAAPPLPPVDQQDTISNGADDDGSGSTALMAIAKAFATGPKPKRSIVLVWHTGEESGLYGSRYNADFPIVPLDKVQAQLNIDMIGRDDCDDLNGDYTNSVFVVGADRISTDLHNLIVDTNATKVRPLTLDYELNDLNDPENIYTRSDHYSYALKGIPIAFFTTGLHKDYHQVSDSVDKILFPKMTRIAQLIYETGFNLASTERVLERDNKGPRTGKGFQGRVQK